MLVAAVAGCGGDATPARLTQDIYSIRVDGSGRQNLTRTPGVSDWLLTHSPTAPRVAFIHGGQLYEGVPGALYVMDDDGGRVMRLARANPGPDGYGPAWSPDGRSLAYVDAVGCGDVLCERFELWTIDVRTRKRRLLARDGVEPTWSANGRWIVYAGDIDRGDEPRGPLDVYVVRADGSGRRRLVKGVAPVAAPRGDAIAYLAYRHEFVGGLHLVRRDGSGRRLVTNLAGTVAAWSPDGARLAFFGPPPLDDSVYVLARDGRRLRRLGPVHADPGDLAWSPDGREVAWVRFYDRGNADQILIGPADGSRRWRKVTRERSRARMGKPVWSQDGERILFAGLAG